MQPRACPELAEGRKPWVMWEMNKPQRGDRVVLTHTDAQRQICQDRNNFSAACQSYLPFVRSALAISGNLGNAAVQRSHCL